MANDFLTREEALHVLAVKAPTLYSYVSRGLIRSISVHGSRRHLYARNDIERIAARGRGRLSQGVLAGAAMRWGEPVMVSGITSIDDAGPIYREHRALDLANSGHAFEDVAHYLATGTWASAGTARLAVPLPEDTVAFLSEQSRKVAASDIGSLMAAMVLKLGMRGRDERELEGATTMLAGRQILMGLVGCMGFLSDIGGYVAPYQDETIAAYALRASGAALTEHVHDALNAVLIVLADHELATASFAARVAASVEASLYHCIAAAIAAHLGQSTGAAPRRLEAWLPCNDDQLVLAEKLAEVQRDGFSTYGFAHPLYPKGDPRAALILSHARACSGSEPSVAASLRFIDQVRRQLGIMPGVAPGLVLLSRALNLPAGAATALWLIARTAGWVAHVIEQRTQLQMLRPRAKYAHSSASGG